MRLVRRFHSGSALSLAAPQPPPHLLSDRQPAAEEAERARDSKTKPESLLQRLFAKRRARSERGEEAAPSAVESAAASTGASESSTPMEVEDDSEDDGTISSAAGEATIEPVAALPDDCSSQESKEAEEPTIASPTGETVHVDDGQGEASSAPDDDAEEQKAVMPPTPADENGRISSTPPTTSSPLETSAVPKTARSSPMRKCEVIRNTICLVGPQFVHPKSTLSAFRSEVTRLLRARHQLAGDRYGVCPAAITDEAWKKALSKSPYKSDVRHDRLKERRLSGTEIADVNDTLSDADRAVLKELEKLDAKEKEEKQARKAKKQAAEKKTKKAECASKQTVENAARTASAISYS